MHMFYVPVSVGRAFCLVCHHDGLGLVVRATVLFIRWVTEHHVCHV